MQEPCHSSASQERAENSSHVCEVEGHTRTVCLMDRHTVLDPDTLRWTGTSGQSDSPVCLEVSALLIVSGDKTETLVSLRRQQQLAA